MSLIGVNSPCRVSLSSQQRNKAMIINPIPTPTADETVSHVRINYKSGAYLQSWFKKFEVQTNHVGVIIDVEYELADVPDEAAHQLAQPIEIGVANIESVWIMSSMSADALYNKAMSV